MCPVLFVLVLLVDSAGHAWIPAPLEHLFSFIVMDVEGEQFLAEIKTLATVFDALFVTVDLEQKQDVVFVYLAVAVVFLQKFLDFLFDLGFQLFLLYIYLSF